MARRIVFSLSEKMLFKSSFNQIMMNRVPRSNTSSKHLFFLPITSHKRHLHVRRLSINHFDVQAPKSSIFPYSCIRLFSDASSTVIPVPSMGDSISEGTVVEWLKKPGEFCAVDEVVVVLETDKVSVDVRAPFAGVIEEIVAKVDETVLVNSPLFKMTPKENYESCVNKATDVSPRSSANSSTVSPPLPKPRGSDEIMTVNVPSMGDSISEGTVVTVFKNIGDIVKADEPVLVIETDKVSIDVNAPFHGKIASFLTKLDQVVQVGLPLFTIEKGDFGMALVASKSESKVSSSTSSAKLISSEPKSVTSREVSSAPAAPVEHEEKSLSSRFKRNETRVQMSDLNIRVAQRQKDTQNDAAMLSTFQECDLSALMSLRDKLGKEFEKKNGLPLGILSFFVKATAMALEKVPAVNAFIDMEEKELVFHDYVDINVAVASQKGIVTPVIRNVENLNITSIERLIVDLSQKAAKNELAIEDLSGGTFSIANQAIYGSLLSTSMLLSPQSAILSLHGIKQRPVASEKNELQASPMMFLSLTYDHRIIDGREAVTFLKSISDTIADPRRMIVQL